MINEWNKDGPTVNEEVPGDEWYEREKAAFIAWWESEGQKKFGETPTLAAGAGWLARAEAVRSETLLTNAAARDASVPSGATGKAGDRPLSPALTAPSDDKEHSDTPRTDAQVWIVKEGGFVNGDYIKGETEVVGAPIARQLERDLTVAKGLEQMAYDQRDKAFDKLNAMQSAGGALTHRLAEELAIILNNKCPGIGDTHPLVVEARSTPSAKGALEVTSEMEEAGMREAKFQYNLPVTRASVYAIFKAMLNAADSRSVKGEG